MSRPHQFIRVRGDDSLIRIGTLQMKLPQIRARRGEGQPARHHCLTGKVSAGGWGDRDDDDDGQKTGIPMNFCAT